MGKGGKILLILITGILLSLFYFPVEFTFLPGQNSKNLVAAAGLVFLLFSFIARREFVMPKEVIVLILIAAFVNIFTIISVTYNHTPEISYTNYVVSTIIWLSGAYAVCSMIRITHGRIDIPLVVAYLTGVSVFQCGMAIAMDMYHPLRNIIDAIFIQGQENLQRMNRIYGIGSYLDVAGSRFSCVLGAIAVLIVKDQDRMSKLSVILYILAFIIITVIGNMIARTTSVGVVLGLGYLLFSLLKRLFDRDGRRSSLVWIWAGVLAVVIPLGVTLYRSVPEINRLIHFGFEGFFAYAETGEFQTASSNHLVDDMLVFPEETKTWIIGDGYFVNSTNDINYLGDATDKGFYMGTDIGYLRFLFLFGLPGLFAMIMVMVYSAITGARAFRRYRMVFIMGLLCGLIVWLKVATDVFPFLVLGVASYMVREILDPDKGQSAEEDEEEAVE